MGGQVGDAGQLILGANTFPISATTKVGNTWLHFLEGEETPAVDATVRLVVDARVVTPSSATTPSRTSCIGPCMRS
jgi:alanyl-tRNA synthetase